MVGFRVLVTLDVDGADDAPVGGGAANAPFADFTFGLGSLAGGHGFFAREIPSISTGSAGSSVHSGRSLGAPPQHANHPSATPIAPPPPVNRSGGGIDQLLHAMAGLGYQPIGGSSSAAVMPGTRIVLGAAAAHHETPMGQHFTGHA